MRYTKNVKMEFTEKFTFKISILIYISSKNTQVIYKQKLNIRLMIDF